MAARPATTSAGLWSRDRRPRPGAAGMAWGPRLPLLACRAGARRQPRLLSLGSGGSTRIGAATSGVHAATRLNRRRPQLHRNRQTRTTDGKEADVAGTIDEDDDL